MTTAVAPRSLATRRSAIEDLPMAAMHAVEVAERQHRMHPARRARIVRKVDDVHDDAMTADTRHEARSSLRALRSLRHVDLQHQPIISQLHTARQRAQVAACGRSWQMCVKYVRSAPMRAATTSIASSTLKCVECGRWRSASMISVRTPSSSGHDSSGMRLQSVRYANDPMRKPSTGSCAVQQRHRHDLDAAERERAGDREQRQLRQAAAGLPRRLEDVREHLAQARRPCAASREARDRRLLHLVEPPHIVEPEDVIGVAVREQDRVDAADVVGERLRAQVGRGVDEDRTHRAGERRALARRAARQSRSGSTAACGGRADRSIGRRRSRSRSPARRATCRCPSTRDSSKAQGSMIRLPPPVDLDEAHAQLVEHLLEHLALLGGQVAARLLLEQREDLDHLRGAFEVRLGALAGHRVGQIAEMDGGGAGQREHERGEATDAAVGSVIWLEDYQMSDVDPAPPTSSRDSSRSWRRCAGPTAAPGIASRRSTR